MKNYKSFCEYLLKDYKGTGYISTIRDCIANSTDMESLKANLLKRGMFLGSLNITIENWMES